MKEVGGGGWIKRKRRKGMVITMSIFTEKYNAAKRQVEEILRGDEK